MQVVFIRHKRLDVSNIVTLFWNDRERGHLIVAD